MKHLYLLLALACGTEIFGLAEDTDPVLTNLMNEVNQLYTELHNSMIALQKNVDEVEATKKELQVTKAQLNTTISELQATKAQLVALNLELQDEKGQSASEIASLRNDLDEQMNTTVATSSGDCGHCGVQITSLRNELDEKMNTTQMELQATQAQLANIPSTGGDGQCALDVAALRNELEETDEEMNTTKLDLQATKAQLTTITSKLQDEKAQCAAKMTSLRNDLGEQINTAIFDIQGTRAQLATLSSKLQDEKGQCTAEITSLRNELETRDEQVNTTLIELQATKEQLANITSKLQDENGQSARDVTSLRNELALKTKDVSFDVQLSGADTSGSRQPVKFNIVHRNEGNGYNATTGKFTAPLSGTYLFSAAIENYGSKKSAYAQIVKEGSVVSSGYGETSADTKTVTIPVTAVTHMKQGEQLWATRCCNVEVYGLYYGSTHFVGALLSVD